MREVYLYACEKCNGVLMMHRDRGSAFYIDQCPACKEWSDFEKIKIMVKHMDNDDETHVFAVENIFDRKEADDTKK